MAIRENVMTYKVHVQGSALQMTFDRYSAADAYRRAMLEAGRFARITC